MSLTPEVTTTAVNKVATAAQYGGSAGAVYFGLTANEIAAFGGLIIAIIGLLVNIWFKHQHLQIAKTKQVSSDE
jgi:hypothetical protein